MVQGGPVSIALSHSDHIARYCRPRDIRSDGRPLRDAFLLRPGELYLSTNWLEYFHNSERQSQIAGVHRALADKGFHVRASASFAVLNVGVTIVVCKNALNLDIQILTLGEPHDPSHTGIYGCPPENTDAATLLAKSVALNEMYSAAT